ncbi:MAG: hypothetical protein ACREO8_10190 [Luteimonas sp.]
MKIGRSLPQNALASLPDADVRVLERATSRLADETQRQAAHYQRQAGRLRKEQTRRKREAKSA